MYFFVCVTNKIGAAGHSCAETLRQEGYTGRVLMITKEKYLPYDRPKLSKVMNLDGNKLALRSAEYYKVMFCCRNGVFQRVI